MTERSVVHSTFVLERVYPAAPAKVYFALSDAAAKRRWFADPDSPRPSRYEMDFRIGGKEINVGGPKEGPLYTFAATYLDIVPNERIVYSYEMLAGDVRISVSLATMEFRPEGAGTRLVLTEQGAFLDGHDTSSSREHGTGFLLDALGKALAADA